MSLHQSVDLANLLTEFATTFLTGDCDLSDYKGVYHYIHTYEEIPIKQRMRRTPIHVEFEEEQHIKKNVECWRNLGIKIRVF